ncbi:hypothetical protein HRI_001238800 [Hibiscus trionum]|uniref:Endonuclease/exonuclease/phosphatase domain-containing protein n=1 Tax=Hibiscus trionum TaxID=183268 RepID=A0A9W7LUH5_HIBTR|nr:hypothetical protein HRI_001238800 [Hibiscus trionum]
MWNSNVFREDKTLIGDRTIAITGTLVKLRERITLINVYAPNDQQERRRFLESSGIISSLQLPVLIAGDFNTVKTREERTGDVVDSRSILDFSKFIQSNGLIESTHMDQKRKQLCREQTQQISIVSRSIDMAAKSYSEISSENFIRPLPDSSRRERLYHCWYTLQVV